ncbi:MAG: hypothetical protein KC543_06915 [Myxococcales bacterium]|nr:hypothetical protein [Myxococcales bacterium]
MSVPVQSMPRVAVRATQPRVTAVPPGRRFREALGRGLLATVEGAAPFVPLPAVVSAAVRSVPGLAGAKGAMLAGAGGGLWKAGGEAVAPGGGVQLPDAFAGGQDEAMRLLALQAQISREERQYTTLSNVLKARHDTAKAVIGNVR